MYVIQHDWNSSWFWFLQLIVHNSTIISNLSVLSNKKWQFFKSAVSSTSNYHILPTKHIWSVYHSSSNHNSKWHYMLELTKVVCAIHSWKLRASNCAPNVCISVECDFMFGATVMEISHFFPGSHFKCRLWRESLTCTARPWKKML